MEPKRLYRSVVDRKIGGVAGGLDEYFDTDPLLIRLAFVILTLAVGGGVMLYFILWVVTPEKPLSYQQFNSNPSGNPEPGPEPAAPADPFKPKDPFQSQDPFRATEPPTPASADLFNKSEKTKGSLIGGLVLITLGILFLINLFVPNIDFGDLWPVILVVIGGGLLFNALSGKK